MRRQLVDLLASSGVQLQVIGSVARGTATAKDLDIVVPSDARELRRLLDALDAIGAWWPPHGVGPSTTHLMEAGHASCTTSFGPVDIFVGASP